MIGNFRNNNVNGPIIIQTPDPNLGIKTTPDIVPSEPKQTTANLLDNLVDNMKNAPWLCSIISKEINPSEEIEKILQTLSINYKKSLDLNGANKEDIQNCLKNFLNFLNEKKLVLQDAEKNLPDNKLKEDLTKALKELETILTEITEFYNDYEKKQTDLAKINKLIDSLPKALLAAMPSEEKIKLAKAICLLITDVYGGNQQQTNTPPNSQQTQTGTSPIIPANPTTTPAGPPVAPATAPVMPVTPKNKINVIDILKASGMSLAWMTLFTTVLAFLISFKLVEFATGSTTIPGKS